MASISVRQLSLAMSGKKFTDLISYRMQSYSISRLETDIVRIISGLSYQIQLEINDITDNLDTISSSKGFWGADCSIILSYVATEIKKHLSKKNILFSEQELIKIFDIFVMSYVLSILQNPEKWRMLKKTPVTLYQHPDRREQAAV